MAFIDSKYCLYWHDKRMRRKPFKGRPDEREEGSINMKKGETKPQLYVRISYEESGGLSLPW